MTASAQNRSITVVGPCASGKSTLVRGLHERGYASARLVAQEHSGVRNLWAWHGQPDALIYLDVGVETINRRQHRTDWTQDALDEQRHRLRAARQACHLYLLTDDLTIPQVLEKVIDFLESWALQRIWDKTNFG
jgi:cytidylate kinase